MVKINGMLDSTLSREKNSNVSCLFGCLMFNIFMDESLRIACNDISGMLVGDVNTHALCLQAMSGCGLRNRMISSEC